MFKTVVISSLVASAAAFAPASRNVRPTALKMAFESELGAQPPLGFWDPLGLLKEADQATFDRLRFTEIKHGRIAMLAVVGHITTTFVRFPGFLDLEGHKFSDYGNGLGALTAIPALGLWQIFLSIGWWELRGWKQVQGSTPGDFGIPYLAQYKTEEQKADIRAKELNQGRAAQMGILALMVHECIDGKPYVINDLLGLPLNF